MLKIAKGVTLTFIGSILFYNLLADALDMPVVYESASTNRCVRVESATAGFSCSNLPQKYIREFTR